MNLQYRDALGGEVRSYDDNARQVTARVCTFNGAPDTYRTTWAPGVFTDSLRQQLPSVCWGHDQRNVIGSVVDYTEQPDGLDVTIQFADFDAVPQARAAYSLIKDGHIRGWSFGFADGKTTPDPKHRGAARFTRATLYEVSPVVRASVPGTRTVSVRSADDGDSETREVSSETLAGTLAAQFADALAKGARSVGVTVNEDGTVDATSATGQATVAVTPDMSGFREALIQGLTEGLRGVTITVGADGSVTTDGDTTAPTGADTGNQGSAGDTSDVISAVDGAIDAAIAYLGQVDLSAMPSEVGMAYQLLQAADVACDELMEAAGIPDYDEDAERAAATGTTDDSGERTAPEPTAPVGETTDQVDVSEGQRRADDLELEAQAALARMNLSRR